MVIKEVILAGNNVFWAASTIHTNKEIKSIITYRPITACEVKHSVAYSVSTFHFYDELQSKFCVKINIDGV